MLKAYNYARATLLFFSLLGSRMWYEGIDKPNLIQKVLLWRVGPTTAWSVAKLIWLKGELDVKW
jgi:hypothetical protein